jgi:hypothetical protein
MENESNKMTAVDFIFSQLPDEYTTTRQGFEVYKQAKEMDKEQRQLSEEEMDMTAKEYVLYNDQKRDWVIEGMKLYREKLKNK